MRRWQVAFAVLDLAVVAAWVVLRVVWFPGGLDQGFGCADSGELYDDTCNQRADFLAGLGAVAGVLVLFTLATGAVVFVSHMWQRLPR